MLKEISDYGPYFRVFQTNDWDEYEIVETVYKNESGAWLDIAQDYIDAGFQVVKTTSLPTSYQNLWDIVSGGPAGDTIIAEPSYVEPAQVTFETSEAYYASSTWEAMQQANTALQTATEAVTAISTQIEQTGMTAELNEALNNAGEAQANALQAYQETENAPTVQAAQVAAQTAELSAQVALQEAAQVVPPEKLPAPVSRFPESPALPVSSTASPMPAILTALGLWAAFRG